MRFKLLLIPAALLVMLLSTEVSGQETAGSRREVNSIIDSLTRNRVMIHSEQKRPDIRFTREEAIKYLNEKYRSGNWSNPVDPFRMSLGQLIYYASHPSYDSAVYFMRRYSFDSINIPWDRFYKWDSLKIKVPVLMPREFLPVHDSIERADTIGLRIVSDSLMLAARKDTTDSVSAYRPLMRKPSVLLKDTVLIVANDTIRQIIPDNKNVPFLYYSFPYQVDSMEVAVRLLTDYLVKRDSSEIRFNSISGSNIPVWLNSRGGKMVRYWLRNEFSDSVTVWIGSTGRDSIGLFLEEGIMFRRPSKQTTINDAQLNLKQVNSARLQDVNKNYIKPQYWKFRSESAFVLNQAFLSNWVKGGESSVSTTMDVTGYANYNNKNINLSSSNFGRIKYGLVASGEKGVRKNLDLLETNSKLNHKAFGKFDFSATMLFKTQLAAGKNYFKTSKGNDTSTVVSKFMNPATLTVGFGLDYKPNKTTSINFSPLSYKGTFVTDTTGTIGIDAIDQTKYGIPKGKKSLNEPGASILFSNETKLFKKITITNRVQLFTNYIHNPLNIDIDWETIATANLNWFTDVRLNTHFIYDDDTKTPVLDDNGQPIPGRKSAKLQFKELVGFSFVFRF